MNYVVSLALTSLLLVGCQQEPIWKDDPELVPDQENPCPNQMNISEIDEGKTDIPDYLPDWAIVFPGSVVTGKNLQCEDDRPAWYSIRLETAAPFEEVHKFYDEHLQDYREPGVAGKYYRISEPCYRVGANYSDFINLVNVEQSDGSERTTIIIGVKISPPAC